MWKEKYRKLMFSNDSSEKNIQEAFKIKFKKLPCFLYKYRVINDFTFDNLLNDTIWFNRASEFNDPYDSGLTMNKEIMIDNKVKQDLINEFCEKVALGVESVSKILENLNSKDTLAFFLYNYSNLKDDPKEVPKIVDGYFRDLYDMHSKYQTNMKNLYQQSIFASCFSETNDSILMWSHYASNHKGICIEYDFKQYGENHILTQNLHPVNYTSKLFDLTTFRESENKINVSTNAALTKAEVWSYEREWRLILTLNSDSKPFNGDTLTPKTIFLGTRISDEHKEKVIKIAEEKNISVKQMHLSNTKYKLYY